MPRFPRSGVQREATPECTAPAVVWNIPLGFSNDLLMALMSLRRGALLHMGLVERREEGGGGERGEKGKHRNWEKDGVRSA